MRSFAFLAFFLALLNTATAQFNIFEQMFGGGGGGQQHHQQPQNSPSDSSYYRAQVDRGASLSLLFSQTIFLLICVFFSQNTKTTAYCTNYLCPDTLACVHFPHHCPCSWPSHEDKFELADGQRICVSRGGFKAGEAARKVELARKGLL